MAVEVLNNALLPFLTAKELSVSTREQYETYCRTSGIASKYWYDPQYALLHFAAHAFKRVFDEEDAELVIAVINNVAEDYASYKNRDNGVKYVLHVVDAALKGQEIDVPFALEGIYREKDLLALLHYPVETDVATRLPVESTIIDLLHDHQENLGFSQADIQVRYGDHVSNVVAGLSKLKSDHWVDKTAAELDDALRFLQLSSLAHYPEIILKKLLSDFRSNASTLQHLKSKGGKSASMRQRDIAQSYIDKFADFILERHLMECYKAIDQCFRFAQPDDYDYFSRIRDRYQRDNEKYHERFFICGIHYYLKMVLIKICITTDMSFRRYIKCIADQKMEFIILLNWQDHVFM